MAASTSFRRREGINTLSRILVWGFFPTCFARFWFTWVHKPRHDGGSSRPRHWLSADPTFPFVLRYDAVAGQASGVAIGHNLLGAKNFGRSMEHLYHPNCAFRSKVCFRMRRHSGANCFVTEYTNEIAHMPTNLPIDQRHVPDVPRRDPGSHEGGPGLAARG
jgi:hypothetical protein